MLLFAFQVFGFREALDVVVDHGGSLQELLDVILVLFKVVDCQYLFNVILNSLDQLGEIRLFSIELINLQSKGIGLIGRFYYCAFLRFLHFWGILKTELCQEATEQVCLIQRDLGRCWFLYDLCLAKITEVVLVIF